MKHLLAQVLCALVLVACAAPPSPKDQLAMLRSSFTAIEDTGDRMSASATLTTDVAHDDLPGSLWLTFTRMLGEEAKKRGHTSLRFDDQFTYSQQEYAGRGASPGITRLVSRRLITSVSVSSATPPPEGFFPVHQPIRAQRAYLERVDAIPDAQRQAQHRRTADRLGL